MCPFLRSIPDAYKPSSYHPETSHCQVPVQWPILLVHKSLFFYSKEAMNGECSQHLHVNVTTDNLPRLYSDIMIALKSSKVKE